MKRSKFIEILKKSYVKYEIKGDMIYVLGNRYGNVGLYLAKSLPENIQFNNGGYIDLNSLKSLPESTQFNNGGHVYLYSLKSLPESNNFNNGGHVYLRSLESSPENIRFNNGGQIIFKLKILKQEKSYIKRFNLKVKNSKLILYKRVSKNFFTQEDKEWKTLWKIGSTLVHPDWEPKKTECGAGKFHACAKPFWCDNFRCFKGDRYVAIEVKVEDIHEWTLDPVFPQKISFREGKVLYECDRYGNKI